MSFGINSLSPSVSQTSNDRYRNTSYNFPTENCKIEDEFESGAEKSNTAAREQELKSSALNVSRSENLKSEHSCQSDGSRQVSKKHCAQRV
jgi:hypothetical protein